MLGVLMQNEKNVFFDFETTRKMISKLPKTINLISQERALLFIVYCLLFIACVFQVLSKELYFKNTIFRGDFLDQQQTKRDDFEREYKPQQLLFTPPKWPQLV